VVLGDGGGLEYRVIVTSQVERAWERSRACYALRNERDQVVGWCQIELQLSKCSTAAVVDVFFCFASVDLLGAAPQWGVVRVHDPNQIGVIIQVRRIEHTARSIFFSAIP
jgi:hypothetical protein